MLGKCELGKVEGAELIANVRGICSSKLGVMPKLGF